MQSDKSLKNVKVTSSVELQKIAPKSSRSMRIDYDERLKKAISEISKPKTKK